MQAIAGIGFALWAGWNFYRAFKNKKTRFPHFEEYTARHEPWNYRFAMLGWAVGLAAAIGLIIQALRRIARDDV